MDIQEKEKIFEASCKKMLAKDVTELNKSIDAEIERQIKDEVEEYEKKEEFVYQKKIEKLEKDYNKQIFAMEMDAKKEILKQGKMIRKNLRGEVEDILKNFVTQEEYKAFLFSKLEEVLQKITVHDALILGITAADEQRFGQEIREKYSFCVTVIDSKYIGGCTLEDKVNGVYIDNTLLSSIDENIG